MAGKKNKQIKLSPEVQKADNLRLKALAAASESTRIRKQSREEFDRAKTAEEKEAVRKKYTALRKGTKFAADKAFSEYDLYIRDTFGISNAHIETNEKFVSTDKGFIDFLEKRTRAVAKIKPAQQKKPKAAAPAPKQEKTVRPNPFAGADDIYVTKNKIAVTKTKKAKAARGFKKTTQTKYYARNRRNVKQLKAVQGDTVRDGRKGNKYTRL